MKKSILFITCQEAHHICDKNQYGEATPWEKIKLGLRLSWCKITRAYTKRNKKLTESLKENNITILKEDERSKIQSEFEKELTKHK